MEKPKWRLHNETKEVIDYKYQKATTHFRGRNWTVWFAPDIPVQDDPWKLWGLPGLILEAQDSAGLYHFAAVGLKNTTTAPITLYKKKRDLVCTT